MHVWRYSKAVQNTGIFYARQNSDSYAQSVLTTGCALRPSVYPSVCHISHAAAIKSRQCVA